MRTQILGQTGIESSHLGFGCVQLTSLCSRREAHVLLEHAFDQGITHFDVARAYGFGRAEGILSTFLRGKRDRVTVATKLGIQPPSGIAGNRWVIDSAKKLLAAFPGMQRRVRQRGGAMGRSGVFAPSAALMSLETSLRELRTDYVDVLFLHEATVAEASDEALIGMLRQQVDKGKVRCLGLASDFSKLSSSAESVPEQYRILQFNDNAANRNLERLTHREQRTIITHSIFQPARVLPEAIATHPEIASKFSLKLGLDLSDPTIVGSLLLRYALLSNSDGIVLFSSTDAGRITTNVRDAEPDGYQRRLPIFTQFVDEILDAHWRTSRGPNVNRLPDGK
ncbi:MAG: aldo/keto reductase [Terriglobales bacterium]|jgi:aryl-alcohol dehydrogenase-like predicted oxidoreductase